MNTLRMMKNLSSSFFSFLFLFSTMEQLRVDNHFNFYFYLQKLYHLYLRHHSNEDKKKNYVFLSKNNYNTSKGFAILSNIACLNCSLLEILLASILDNRMFFLKKRKKKRV